MCAVPRLAASNYLNAAPVVFAFSTGSQSDLCHLLSDPAPSACSQMLAEASVDAALIPAIEFARIPGLAIAQGVCIGARRTVGSVLLISKVPIERIGRVALDTQSRTSATLVRILLERFQGLSPEYSPAAPDLPAMLESNDAALMIGDPAMTARKEGLFVYDLAALWRERTEMPFVFAVWALYPDRLDATGLDFERARLEGTAAIPEIAAAYAPALGLGRDYLTEYLTRQIHYELDDESIAGLELFYRFAAEQRLIREARPLRFWSAPD